MLRARARRSLLAQSGTDQGWGQVGEGNSCEQQLSACHSRTGVTSGRPGLRVCRTPGCFPQTSLANPGRSMPSSLDVLPSGVRKKRAGQVLLRWLSLFSESNQCPCPGRCPAGRFALSLCGGTCWQKGMGSWFLGSPWHVPSVPVSSCHAHGTRILL